MISREDREVWREAAEALADAKHPFDLDFYRFTVWLENQDFSDSEYNERLDKKVAQYEKSIQQAEAIYDKALKQMGAWRKIRRQAMGL